MIKVQSVSGKQLKIKVPRPRAKPSSVRLFARNAKNITSPLLSKKSYAKNALHEDPSEFYNAGFGDTGLTGES